MTGRSKTGSFAEDLAKTPGPGHYKILDPNVVKRRGPAYSILGRSYMPGGKENLLYKLLRAIFISLYIVWPLFTHLLASFFL